MRTRINNITFTPGTRSINTGITDLTVDDVRLFINESQMKVICSSMQKNNITVTSGVVTYNNTFPVLVDGDHITFEIDRGDDVAKKTDIPNDYAKPSDIPSVIEILDGLATLTSVDSIASDVTVIKTTYPYAKEATSLEILSDIGDLDEIIEAINGDNIDGIINSYMNDYAEQLEGIIGTTNG